MTEPTLLSLIRQRHPLSGVADNLRRGAIALKANAHVVGRDWRRVAMLHRVLAVDAPMNDKTTDVHPLAERLNDEMLEALDEELELELDDDRLDAAVEHICDKTPLRRAKF